MDNAVDRNPNCFCPQCNAYEETSFDIGTKDGVVGVWGECEACGHRWFTTAQAQKEVRNNEKEVGGRTR